MELQQSVVEVIAPVTNTGNPSLGTPKWLKQSSKRVDRKSTRLNSSHIPLSRMPSSA